MNVDSNSTNLVELLKLKWLSELCVSAFNRWPTAATLLMCELITDATEHVENLLPLLQFVLSVPVACFAATASLRASFDSQLVQRVYAQVTNGNNGTQPQFTVTSLTRLLCSLSLMLAPLAAQLIDCIVDCCQLSSSEPLSPLANVSFQLLNQFLEQVKKKRIIHKLSPYSQLF